MLATTDAAPAATFFGNHLYVFVKGLDNGIYNNSAPDGQAFTGWGQAVGGSGRTESAPAAASLGDRLYVFVRGLDNGIWVNSAADGHSFAGWAEVPGGGRTESAPAAASLAKGLYVFVRGLNNGIWVNKAQLKLSIPSGTRLAFGGWAEVAGGGRTDAALAAASLGNRLYVFGKGIDDKKIYVNSAADGQPFGGWTPVTDKVHVVAEVHRVHCGNTEDASGADELYIVGALSDGTTSKGVLTSPMSINDNEHKEFDPSQRVIFDADVEPDAVLRGGLKAYDEDFAKDWSKHGETVTAIGGAVAAGLRESGNPTAVAAGTILGFATAAANFLAPLDKDDHLGTCELNVSAQGQSAEEIVWKFQKKGALGYSTWNYSVVIRITRN